jgi:hypothetical protein
LTRDFPKDSCLPLYGLAFSVPPGFRRRKRQLLGNFSEFFWQTAQRKAICKEERENEYAFCKTQNFIEGNCASAGLTDQLL